ncbi:MAG: hypothetical protein ACK4FM_02505 [Caldimicrobium sp.]
MIEKLTLPNGLILEIWNYSRKLAGDRWLVGFLAQIAVEPKKEDFSGEIYYEYFLKHSDGKLYYRYRKERTFVPEEDVKLVYENIKRNFIQAVLPYLSREDFKDNFLRTEVALYEKKVDWNLYLQKKEKEEEELEKLWKDKHFI